MGCSSCGQKYRGLLQKKSVAPSVQRAVLKKRPVKYYKGRMVVTNSPVKKVELTGEGAHPAVTVSPDVVTSPSAPVPAYAIDPSTGFPVDVIMTGECKENSLGDTRAFPVDMNSISVPPQESYGPAFGKDTESAAEDKSEKGEE